MTKARLFISGQFLSGYGQPDSEIMENIFRPLVQFFLSRALLKYKTIKTQYHGKNEFIRKEQ